MTEPHTPYYPERAPFPPAPSDEIDLRLVVRALWRGRWWIVGLTVLGGLLGITASLLSTKYQSRGLFLTPGVTIASYKTYAAALDNPPRWQRFVAAAQPTDAETVELITRRLEGADPSAFGEMIAPVFTITESEAKKFGVKLEDGQVGLVGFNLTLNTKQRREQAPIATLAEYVRSTIIRTDLTETLQNACVGNQSAELEIENDQLKNNFSIAQNEERRKVLAEINARTPQSSRIDSQIVALADGNQRFLSPTTQLIGVDVAIANTRLDNVVKERALVAARIKEAYYCRAVEMIEQPGSGPDVLAKLAAIQGEALAGEDPKSDIVQQTSNEITIQRENWRTRYMTQMRFVTPPEGAEVKVRKPRGSVGLAAGLFVGGLFGLLFALLDNWWRDNRDLVLAR